MRNNKEKTVVLSLVLACVLFMASSGQTMALDRDFGADHDRGLFVEFLDRVGDFFNHLVGEVVEIVAKSGPVPDADG